MAEQVLLFHPYWKNLKGQIRVSEKQVKQPSVAVLDATAMDAHNHHPN